MFILYVKTGPRFKCFSKCFKEKPVRPPIKKEREDLKKFEIGLEPKEVSSQLNKIIEMSPQKVVLG